MCVCLAGGCTSAPKLLLKVEPPARFAAAINSILSTPVLQDKNIAESILGEALAPSGFPEGKFGGLQGYKPSDETSSWVKAGLRLSFVSPGFDTSKMNAPYFQLSVDKFSSLSVRPAGFCVR